MELKPVEAELEALGLEPIILNVLHPDHASYSVLLNQFKGVLQATPEFVGNSDDTKDLAATKFVEFAKIAQNKDYDLAACPEYSFPWIALEQLHNSKVLPNTSKVWVFGMESITPAELKGFVAKNSNITWVYDKGLCDEAHQKKFLDPACILFKAKSKSSNEIVDVCVVQFKTSHMSVHGDKYLEANHLIEGRYIYLFKNAGSSIYLATLICSDSLTFDLKLLLDQNIDKLLLLHIQMNLEPRHTTFKKYRNDIFANAELDKIEVLCLNWAKDSEVLAHKIKYSGTGYFYKSPKPFNEDERLDHNQMHGMFYTYWKNTRCHAIFFSSGEMLIGFHTDKTSQVLAVTQLQRRKGPVGFENYVWENNKYSLIASLPDKFKLHCDSLNCDLSPLHSLSYINQERLIKLSTGLDIKKDSFQVNSFDFFIINDNEYINRITFTEEPDASTSQVKHQYLMRLKELVQIFKNKALFPIELTPLTENSKIQYNINTPFVNVFSEEGASAIGTAVYIGADVETTAKSTYDNLNKLYIESIPAFARNREMPKIIIWYHDGPLKHYFIPNTDINKDFEIDDTSIDKHS